MRKHDSDLSSWEIPVAMDMGGTEGKAVVDESGVDEDALLRPLQQVIQVTQVSVAATYSVASTVLIQHKHLAWAEPPLFQNKQVLISKVRLFLSVIRLL